MQSPFLTIAEAASKTGRSHSTIRRLIKTIAEDTSLQHREGIEPTPKAVEAFKKKGENFTWKIREDVLIKNFPGAPMQEEKSSSGPMAKMKDDILHILKKELDLKNDQIEKQLQVIQSLNERLREGNILMGSLQQRLSLPHPESPVASPEGASDKEASMEAIHRASKKKVMEAKHGIFPPDRRAGMKASTEASVKTEKKGMLSWLFR